MEQYGIPSNTSNYSCSYKKGLINQKSTYLSIAGAFFQKTNLD